MHTQIAIHTNNETKARVVVAGSRLECSWLEIESGTVRVTAFAGSGGLTKEQLDRIAAIINEKTDDDT